jgi:hypothetical protein
MRSTIVLQRFALIALAQFFIPGATAHAQQTDGRLLLGGGIVPLSFAHATVDVEQSPPEHTVTSTRTGLGGDVQLAIGYGLGSWVLAIETALTFSVDSTSAAIATSATDRRSTYSEVQIGPSARYLFNEGNLRWFLEAGAGVGWAVSSTSMTEGESTTLYARGGPGMQIRLADPVSIDLALRIGYATTSAEVEVTTSSVGAPHRISRSNLLTALTDYSIAETTLDVAARLSIWL